MSFDFRGHKAAAYSQFALLLMGVIIMNLIAIIFFYPWLKPITVAAERSLILTLPWFLVLFLPSVLLGIFSYYSFEKTYRLTVEEDTFTIELIKPGRRAERIIKRKQFQWHELITIHTVDFEDNHYCNLEFINKKDNLVIHRDSGPFEGLYEEVRRYRTGRIE